MDNEKRSGQTFIAYKGTEISQPEIIHTLESVCPDSYKVKYKKDDDTIFAKVVYNNYVEDRDPHWNNATKILSVNGFNQEELMKANQKLTNYSINDVDRYHRIINHIYGDHKTEMFKMLSEYMHFCSVLYDINNNSIVAGVTTPKGKFTHLYFGYTKNNEELMYSNDKNILKKFCDEIIEMPENSYMIDDNIYNFDGDIIEIKRNAPLIKKTEENANSLIDGLNILLNQVINDSIKNKIEQDIEDYLSSKTSKKRIEDYISNELDKETQT